MAYCKYVYSHTQQRSLVSPATGKKMSEYIEDSLRLIGKRPFDMEKEYGFYCSPIRSWLRGQSNPSLETLLKWETVTGLPLDDYFPEIHAGLDLMAHAKDWERGFLYCIRQAVGCHISKAKRAECLAGTMTMKGLMPQTPMAFVAAKKLFDEFHADDPEKAYVPRQKIFLKSQADDSTEMDVVNEYGEEGTLAAKMCRWATGQNSTKAYGLTRLKDGLWSCELETTYRIELDVGKKMVRWFWKKTGDMRYERCYHGA